MTAEENQVIGQIIKLRMKVNTKLCSLVERRKVIYEHVFQMRVDMNFSTVVLCFSV